MTTRRAESDWGVFPTGGVWAAMHLWDHFTFTGDLRFLAEHAYPILKESAEFCLAYLVRDRQTGWLVSGPANSPENAFLHEGKGYTVALGPTVDHVLIRELFDACIEASRALDVDADFRAKLQSVCGQLPPYQSRNNMTLFYARLADSRAAYNNLMMLFRVEAGDSLFAGTRLAPACAYELDYNTGATAGIAEMLLQSHAGVISLLPTLPDEWPEGSVEGLCARGGFEVDITWRNHTLVAARIHYLLSLEVKH